MANTIKLQLKQYAKQMEERRAKLGTSKYRLVKDCGMTPPTVTRIFQGGNAGIDKWMRLIEELGGTLTITFPKK